MQLQRDQLSGYYADAPIVQTDERVVWYAAARGDFPGTTISYAKFKFIETEEADGNYDWTGWDDVEILELYADDELLPECGILKQIAHTTICKALENWYPFSQPFPSETIHPEDAA